jgi:hypothetical protein
VQLVLGSVSPAGRSSGRAMRMPAGTVWSTSATSDGTPTAAVMRAISASSGPMCLRAN